jgi:uncharacterized protein (TIGR02391 family)
MGISDAIKKLWQNGFFETHRTVSQIDKQMFDEYGVTSSNTATILKKCCKEYLRKVRKGWIQKIGSPLSKSYQAIDYFKMHNIHPTIAKVSKKLFDNKHYSQAIFEAFKKINIMVKVKSDRSDLDGKALMLTVFSVNNPILKFNRLKTQSDRDEQEGFMHLFAGAIMGIRNPKGHEIVIQKDMTRTLSYLSFASLLCHLLNEARK